MPDFQVRVLNVPLRDVLLGSDDDWRAAFHDTGHVEPLTLNERVLGLVEDYLDIDLTGDLTNLERYVLRGLRDKTAPPAGNRLGELMEGLTWLRALRESRDLVRVVGTEPPTINGKPMPRPDFIEREADGKFRLIEVKSTDALSAKKLARGPAGPRPCTAARRSAKDALDQLGVDRATLARLGSTAPYALALREDAARPPFPGDSATAVVWLARDKRLDTRGLEKVKGTPPCGRSRWTCAECLGPPSDPRHLVQVEMPNAPGLVPLWPGRGDMAGWWHAYKAWELADWVRHSALLSRAADALWRQTLAWASSFDEGAEAVLPWWHRHLTTRAPGWQAELPTQGGPPRDVDRVQRDPPTGPRVDAGPGEIDLHGGQDVSLEGVQEDLGLWTLRLEGRRLDARLKPFDSVAEGGVERVADGLLEIVNRRTRQVLSAYRPQQRPVEVQGFLLGWSWFSILVDVEQWMLSSSARPDSPRWMAGRLNVLADGRARLVADLEP